MKSLRRYMPIACLFVAVLLISNITSTKLVTFGPLTFDAGTLLFPLAYILGDIITEVYGYVASRRIIWMGLCSSLLLAGLVMLVGWMPAAADWPYQEAYMQVLGLTPRIILASIIAYFIGEFSNAYIFVKIKIVTQGKAFWKRALGSTLVGQGLDTILFVLIAFGGVFPGSVIWTIIFSNYLLKLGAEVLVLPLTSRVSRWLKHEEGGDIYDTTTNFSPFQW